MWSFRLLRQWNFELWSSGLWIMAYQLLNYTLS
jgi:hypothetical protein